MDLVVAVLAWALCCTGVGAFGYVGMNAMNEGRAVRGFTAAFCMIICMAGAIIFAVDMFDALSKSRGH